MVAGSSPVVLASRGLLFFRPRWILGLDSRSGFSVWILGLVRISLYFTSHSISHFMLFRIRRSIFPLVASSLAHRLPINTEPQMKSESVDFNAGAV
ncbi:hypothetical protein CBD41_03090, partial [bacterium TMED181]